MGLLSKCGTGALLRFVGAALVLALLQVARVPLVVIVRVLDGVMCRLDGYATGQAGRRGLVNRFAVPADSVAVSVPVMGGAR